jgi:2-methylcitrate dehydratase PrpD
MSTMAVLLIMTQGTVVFPSALAVAQDVKASGREFLAACVVGYEFACRTGEFLGPTHYKVGFIFSPFPQISLICQ